MNIALCKICELVLAAFIFSRFDKITHLLLDCQGKILVTEWRNRDSNLRSSLP